MISPIRFAVEGLFMSGNVPVFWVLVGFNAIFLGIFVFRRVAGMPPLAGPLALLSQGIFVAVTCLFFFQEEAQQLLNWLIGLL
jgi:hypothetical protein